MSNRTRLAAAAALTLACTAGTSMPAFADHGGGHKLIKAEMLMGVTQAETKIKNDRGIAGGGLPWVVLGEGELTVRADGRVKMEVEGLVIDPAETAVPALAGTNPSPVFKVIVSCLDADGMVTNVSTGTTPATATGNAELETTIALPAVCMSPKAFVTSGGGAWFAQT
jgi:hypothetical protein